MKLLCLLLTGYLFVLSFLPCAGCDHKHHPVAEGTIAVSIFPEKNPQRHPEADACDPFCGCTCDGAVHARNRPAPRQVPAPAGNRTRLKPNHQSPRQPPVFAAPRVGALEAQRPPNEPPGWGLGYKAPLVFTEETEQRNYRQVLLPALTVRPERSTGANWDANYRHRFGRLGVNVNHLFFYTRINNPAMLRLCPPTCRSSKTSRFSPPTVSWTRKALKLT